MPLELLMCCCADSFPGDPEPGRWGGCWGKSQEIPGEILGKDTHTLHQSLVRTELWWNPFKWDSKQRCKLAQKYATVFILLALYCSLLILLQQKYFKKSFFFNFEIIGVLLCLFALSSKEPKLAGSWHNIHFKSSQVRHFFILFNGKHGCHTSRNVHV